MARINKALIRRQEAIKRRRYELFAERVVYRALRETIKPILDDYDNPLSMEPIEKAIMNLYVFIGSDSAKKEYDRLSIEEPVKAAPSDFFLNTWRRWMTNYVQLNLGKMIVDITSNTRDTINKAIAKGAEEGLTRGQISKLIEKETLGEIGKRRARVIARTEGMTAANEGKTRSSDDWEKERGTRLYKLWIHSGSPNERSWHVEMDSRPPIPKEDKFVVTNPNTGVTSYMDFPAEVNAPAVERIQCNCVVVYMSERKARRDYPGLLDI